MARKDQQSLHSTWKPPAFRSYVLLAAVLFSWTLIAILQYLLVRSQREGGIIFAPDATDMPLSKSFSYLYLPTIIALLFSIYWSWIDLQIKRLEPYHQLSKPGGSSGKESMLLSYPFDFLPFVPITAVRNGHWAVFWASTAIVVVTWGLVPVQAGIFATETIVRTAPASFELSTAFVPADEQNTTLDGRFIQSAHGIIWLNETLPPYMSRDYMLLPFQAKSKAEVRKEETWKGFSRMYSVDMNCEKPIVVGKLLNASNGCYYDSDLAVIGNDSYGADQPAFKYGTVSQTKEFSARFIGYYSTMNSDYYLEGYCPKNETHTFLASFTRNKKREEDPPGKVTQLFCTPSYYYQHVTATIDAKTRRPLSVTPRGPKQSLPPELWDSKLFEYLLNEGSIEARQKRGGLPMKTLPKQHERLSNMPITLSMLAQMVGYAIGASNRPLEDLLDPENLRSAYEAAYRIIFARSMAEILDSEFARPIDMEGQMSYASGVVVVVPAFTYVVDGLLGLVSICALALLYISLTRRWQLHSDPVSIAAVMALVADEPEILETFGRLDCSANEEFDALLGDKNFELCYDESGNRISEKEYLNAGSPNATLASSNTMGSQIPKPVRPREFRSFLVVPFVSLQIALAITVGLLWMRSQPFGLARPSANPIVRQIVENYIPTALATLIEPVWILINRLMCMLQPLEELRKGSAAPEKSINQDYSSLPPQLVVMKALRSSHFKLAAVCMMAWLANILAIASSSIFEEKPISISRTMEFYPPFQSKFVPVNGSVYPGSVESSIMKPSGAYRGGEGDDIFVSAQSIFTAGTAMPPWTDDRFLYVPFTGSALLHPNGISARTAVFGAELDCEPIGPGEFKGNFSMIKSGHIVDSTGNLTVTARDGNGRKIVCSAQDLETSPGPEYFLGGNFNSSRCDTGAVSLELVPQLSASANASQTDKDFCAETMFFGWARYPGDLCAKEEDAITLGQDNAVFVACRPRLVAGVADVTVNGNERVVNSSQLKLASTDSPDFTSQHFSNDPSNLLKQAKGYFLRQRNPVWHNDASTSDFINYFITKHSNDSSTVDPSLPPPTSEIVIGRLRPVYSKLFAIWLGLNRDQLLTPSTNSAPVAVTGTVTEQHIRIFLPKPTFIIVEAILAIYAIVAITLYLWRPGRFLPRQPKSIAANIALFAAGSAVRDMKGTSLFSRRKMKQHLKDLSYRYSYGTYLGARGGLHIGIEKDPLVKAIPVPGLIGRVQTGLSKKSWKSTSMFRKG